MDSTDEKLTLGMIEKVEDKQAFSMYRGKGLLYVFRRSNCISMCNALRLH